MEYPLGHCRRNVYGTLHWRLNPSFNGIPSRAETNKPDGNKTLWVLILLLMEYPLGPASAVASPMQCLSLNPSFNGIPSRAMR